MVFGLLLRIAFSRNGSGRATIFTVEWASAAVPVTFESNLVQMLIPTARSSFCRWTVPGPLIAAILVLGSGRVGASPEGAAPNRPNILLIVSEDNGPELGCYGEPSVQTPVLDALASKGVLFKRAYVPQADCSQSRAALLTGLYPHQNGQLGLATHNYGWFKRWPTTYSRLKKAGSQKS